VATVARARQHPFHPAPKSGIEYQTKLTEDGPIKTIELESRQAFNARGEIIETKYRVNELQARLEQDGNMDLQWYSTNTDGRHIGREMISTAVENFGPVNVRSISARLGRTNLDVYNSSLADGLSQSQAAWNTPLGKAMRDLGFSQVNATRAPYRVMFEY
jgi:hypothetical protein